MAKNPVLICATAYVAARAKPTLRLLSRYDDLGRSATAKEIAQYVLTGKVRGGSTIAKSGTHRGNDVAEDLSRAEVKALIGMR